MSLPRVSISRRSALILAEQASRMGHRQMLRVSKVEGWLIRQRAAGSASCGPRDEGGCLIVRTSGQPAGDLSPVTPASLPGEHGPVHRAGSEDCRRSRGDLRPGGSGPSSGEEALRLHLVMMAPGTRGEPHFHDGRETAVYVVSGEAEVWHGTGLAKRSTVRRRGRDPRPAGRAAPGGQPGRRQRDRGDRTGRSRRKRRHGRDRTASTPRGLGGYPGRQRRMSFPLPRVSDSRGHGDKGTPAVASSSAAANQGLLSPLRPDSP